MNADKVPYGPQLSGENTVHVLGWLMTCLLALLLCACGGGGGGTSGPAPAAITAQPSSVSVTTGAAATFSVTASGDGISYQWQRSVDSAVTWVDIASATSASYTIDSVDVTLNGYQYRAVVTGSVNSVTTSAVTLNVAAAAVAPVITVAPANQSVVAGANASFSVTATGTSLTYQWQASADGSTWSGIAGATAATYSLSAVAPSDSGHRFRVVVSNSVGSVTSSSALLTVTLAPAAPAITTQPQATVSVVAGQTATLTVVATGNPAPTYQWQSSSDNGATFGAISGATAASYTTPATTSSSNGTRYRVVITNSQGSVTSNASTLSVAASTPPIIALAPTTSIAYYPDNDFGAARAGTFTATATGSPTPTYQWQISTDGGSTFTNITGATSATYTTPTVTAADNGKRFRVVATNAAGTVASAQAALQVANLGFGSAVTALAVRPSGEILATINGAVGCAAPYCGGTMGVRALTTSGTLATLAGQGYTGGDTDGTGAAASFYSPVGIVLDPAGNAYVTDNGNRVRKITPAGVVSTLAGSGAAGFVNDTGALASFTFPAALTIDGSGNLYVVESADSAIRKVTPGGTVTTLAQDTTLLKSVTSVAFNPVNGQLVVGTQLCKLFTLSLTGTLTLIGGAGGCTNTVIDGPLATAGFTTIRGLAVDSSGNIFLAGFDLRKIAPDGQVSTLTGTTNVLWSGLATDAAGNAYSADPATNRVHKFAPNGTSTITP